MLKPLGFILLFLLMSVSSQANTQSRLQSTAHFFEELGGTEDEVQVLFCEPLNENYFNYLEKIREGYTATATLYEREIIKAENTGKTWLQEHLRQGSLELQQEFEQALALISEILQEQKGELDHQDRLQWCQQSH
jgi:hypothetical protein